MPLNRLIENSGGYAGFADNCYTPVNEKPLQTPRGLQGLIPKKRRKYLPQYCFCPRTAVLRLPQRFFCRRSIDGV